MLLNRAYRTSIPPETGKEPHKDISSFHLSRFSNWLGSTSGSSILYNSMPINYASLPTI